MKTQMIARVRKRIIVTITAVCAWSSLAQATDLRQAVQTAVSSNPGVLETAANRRAADQEYRQAQGAFLPRLNLNGEAGPERVDRPGSLPPSTNDTWNFASQLTVSVEQLLFDGFASVNEIYRQSARVDGAALRVLESAEAIALDAVEAYVDVLRLRAIVAKSRQNVAKHEQILNEVRQRYEGGETGAADLYQASERVSAAKALVFEVEQTLLENTARYERVIGQKPGAIAAARPATIPSASVESLITRAARVHPQIRSALADMDAATFERESTKGAFMPEVSLLGQATVGNDVGGVSGRSNEYAGKVIFSWNLFNGGRDTARNLEFTERLTATQLRVDRVRREIKEAIERSWAAVTQQRKRIGAVKEQLSANRQVVDGYRQEYEIGQRTLLDVLNAENALFNSEVELLSVQAIHTFSTYQLRATSGDLLAYLHVTPPDESIDGQRDNVSIFPTGSRLGLEPLRKF